MRNVSRISPDWWDYTTLPKGLLDEARCIEKRNIQKLKREGFDIVLYETLEEFYLAEALEYVEAWEKATPDNPAGICGPIGPIEQLPLVARIINELGLKLSNAHFWGMDEWYEDGKPVDQGHPLSFVRTNMELWYERIRPELRMPPENIHFPVGDLDEYSESFCQIRCVIMQGGQGEAKHWAFNDPPRRKEPYVKEPPLASEYMKLKTRVVDLHPLTVIQNARTSTEGNASIVPVNAATVGPHETMKAERVSIWHPGNHDSPFGIRLTSLMISRRIMDTSVPMSLLAEHPDVRFHIYLGAL